MNRQELDILRTTMETPFVNQRILAEASGHSLGVVNRCLKSLVNEGYLTVDNVPTQQAVEECRRRSPRNAIILAAGFGIRMVPINLTAPKAMLVVRGFEIHKKR